MIVLHAQYDLEIKNEFYRDSENHGKELRLQRKYWERKSGDYSFFILVRRRAAK